MEKVLTVQGIYKSYKDKKALEDINFEIQKGEIIGLIGNNGAGKSTLIQILAGLKKQDKGEFKFIFPKFAAKQDLGIMCQEVSMPKKLKVKEWLKMASLFYENPYTLEEVIDIAGIKSFANTYAAKLSGGQKRRVQYALAILGKPKLLFLDEPTVGMDLETRTAFWKQLQEMASKGVTVLLASHDLFEIESIVNRVIMIDKGKLILDQKMEEIEKKAVVVIRIIMSTLDQQHNSMVQNFIQQFKNVRQTKDFVELIPENMEETVLHLQKMGLTYENFEVQKQGLQDLVRTKIGDDQL